MSQQLSKLILFWNKKADELFNFHTNPGHDARRFAVIHIALYDTLNLYKGKYKFYSDNNFPKIQTLQSAMDALNGAARKVLLWAVNDVKNYATLIGAPPSIDGFNETYCLQQIQSNPSWWPINQPVDQNAKTLGENMAQLIINKANNDGAKTLEVRTLLPLDGAQDGMFNSDYYSFPPFANPDLKKLMVQFEGVDQYVLSSPQQFRSTWTPTESEMQQDYQTVAIRGSLDTPINNVELKNKVDFWKNLRQHIVWNYFTREFIWAQNIKDPWDIARIFALIHTAMLDGAICMFSDIYHFYRWRPISALNPDPNNRTWNPRYETPRVPEYPSAFGILGGAVGEILTKINGNNDSINEVSLELNSTININYNKISDAVMENTETKVDCGWNFPSTVQPSIEQGREIGKYVLGNKFQQLIKIPKLNPIPKSKIPKIKDEKVMGKISKKSYKL